MTKPKTMLVGVGGVIIKDGEVLLVQVNYGRNKGLWMIPGGFVEPGESLEKAVIREVKEEAGLSALPKRIVGMRCGVRHVGDEVENSLYIVFEMMNATGDVFILDTSEISGIKFESISEALENPNVIELTKQFIKASMDSEAGLYKLSKMISTNTNYLSYDVYSAQ